MTTGNRLPPSLKLPLLLALCAAPLMLSGCSGVRQALGVERSSPDEFAVIDQAPLVVPPDFRLRPPDDRGGRTRVIDSRRVAASTIFGEGARDFMDGAVGASELALLQAAGTEIADPDIVAILEWETTGRVTDPELADRIVNYDTPDEVVAAEAEQQRLRRNRRDGRRPDEGAVPTIERRGDGGFMDIF